jgi:hypothetical protein
MWSHFTSVPSKSRVDTTDDDTAFYVISEQSSSTYTIITEEFRTLHSQHPFYSMFDLPTAVGIVDDGHPDPWMIEPIASHTLNSTIRILPRPSPR